MTNSSASIISRSHMVNNLKRLSVSVVKLIKQRWRRWGLWRMLKRTTNKVAAILHSIHHTQYILLMMAKEVELVIHLWKRLKALIVHVLEKAWVASRIRNKRILSLNSFKRRHSMRTNIRTIFVRASTGKPRIVLRWMQEKDLSKDSLPTSRRTWKMKRCWKSWKQKMSVSNLPNKCAKMQWRGNSPIFSKSKWWWKKWKGPLKRMKIK